MVGMGSLATEVMVLVAKVIAVRLDGAVGDGVGMAALDEVTEVVLGEQADIFVIVGSAVGNEADLVITCFNGRKDHIGSTVFICRNCAMDCLVVSGSNHIAIHFAI